MSARPDPQTTVWKVNAPQGGWPPPWPQLVEIVQACAATDPVGDRARMIGSDRRRILALWQVLQDENHRSWLATGTNARRGRAALRMLVGS